MTHRITQIAAAILQITSGLAFAAGGAPGTNGPSDATIPLIGSESVGDPGTTNAGSPGTSLPSVSLTIENQIISSQTSGGTGGRLL